MLLSNVVVDAYRASDSALWVYNIQFAVDVKHKLIAEQAVSNQVLDLGLLAQTATAAMEALGVGRIEAVSFKRL